MKLDIIPIGNSKGIRIPKALLEQCGFEQSVEIAVENQRLVLSPIRRPRSEWEKAFKAMAEAGDDALLDSSTPTDFDKSEWQW